MQLSITEHGYSAALVILEHQLIAVCLVKNYLRYVLHFVCSYHFLTLLTFARLICFLLHKSVYVYDVKQNKNIQTHILKLSIYQFQMANVKSNEYFFGPKRLGIEFISYQYFRDKIVLQE